MAILTAIPGMEITIQSCDPAQDLPEYPDEGEWPHKKFHHLAEDRRVSKYVECVPNTEFRIRIVLKHPFSLDSPGLTFKASVDGHGIAQATCSAEIFARLNNMYMEIMSSKLERLSATEISSKSLKFSSITKIDDQDSTRVKQDAKLVASIGEIVVSVFRTAQRETLPMPGQFQPSRYQPPKEVAEKALKGKAISTGVAYGEPKFITRVGRETVDLDGPNNPIAVFVFQYRTREDLKAELIIPRSPSPELFVAPRRAQSRNSGNLPVSRDARLANLKREIAEIKAEEDELPRGRKRSANDEVSRSGRAYKTSRGRHGSVVIDLTDD